MGYTHYLRRPKTLNKTKFKLVLKDMELFMKSNLHKLVGRVWFVKGGDGTGEPIFTEDLICFNGMQSVLEDLSHETMYVERVMKPRNWQTPEKGKYFEFCKTARKPYDILVCLCLLSLKEHFGDKVEISSDGDRDDWENAIKAYEEITKRKVSEKFLRGQDELQS